MSGPSTPTSRTCVASWSPIPTLRGTCSPPSESATGSQRPDAAPLARRPPTLVAGRGELAAAGPRPPAVGPGPSRALLLPAHRRLRTRPLADLGRDHGSAGRPPGAGGSAMAAAAPGGDGQRAPGRARAGGDGSPPGRRPAG